jgi:hypothetical protein
MFMLVVVTRRGKVGHMEGKGEERVIAILRFQGGSPSLC